MPPHSDEERGGTFREMKPLFASASHARHGRDTNCHSGDGRGFGHCLKVVDVKVAVRVVHVELGGSDHSVSGIRNSRDRRA